MGDKPFQALQRFGMTFLNRFEAAICNSPILQVRRFRADWRPVSPHCIDA